MHRQLLLAFALLFLAACSSSRSSFDWPTESLQPSEREALFDSVETAQSFTYGVTPEDPIRIGHYGPYKGVQAAKEMLSRLRKNGKPLQVLGRFSTRHSEAPDSTEATPAPYGVPTEGTILDAYTAVPSGTQDTLQLYFDSYYAAPLRAPEGMGFAASRPR